MGIQLFNPSAAGAAHARDLAELKSLRESIARQIKSDMDRVDCCIRTLDLIDGDTDLEPGADDEDGHDAEGHTDGNGIADDSGLERV